jgi:DNA-binding CsgD family transcriptional regulator/PAS domain-containing protein
MALDEGLSSFIGRLYEAVHDPVAWRAIVGELLDRTGSRLAFISTVDVRHREYSRAMFFGKEDSSFARGIEEYQEEQYLADPSLIWASQHPNAGVCETEAIIPRNDYLKDPYIVWQKSRLGTTHWRVFYTAPADDLTFALSLHPPAEVGPPSRESRALHRIIFEHMERAFRLAARPPRFANDSEPVVVLDTSGRLMTMSPRAEALLAERDGLSLDGRRLEASSDEISRQLQLMIHSAVGFGSDGGAGGGLRIPRGSGKPELLVLVSPCPRFLDHLPMPTAAAIVRIIEPNAAETLSPQHAALFELTRRELEVAEALLHGHSLESLANSLGMSRNTARVHLQSLFQKTRTNRQADLVHLLAEISRE